ncbi:molybdopterin oxidoreductase family protein, partial [Vibrio parahaemolyticus V-223/04]
KSCTCFRRN